MDRADREHDRIPALGAGSRIGVHPQDGSDDDELYADGKVVTPLYKAKPGDTRLDRATGELRLVRCEADAGLHFEGTGETAWGTKWVMVAVRTEDVHGRVILDVDWVPTPGGEAATAMASFDRLAPLAPGAQGVTYDTALRGVHHQHLLRDLGLLPLNKVTAAVAATKWPRRKAALASRSPPTSKSAPSRCPTAPPAA